MDGKIMLVTWGVPQGWQGMSVVTRNLGRQFTADQMVIVGEEPDKVTPIGWQDPLPQVFAVASTITWSCRASYWWRRLMLPVICLRMLRLARKHDCRAIVAIYPNSDYLVAGFLVARWTGAKFFPYYHNLWVENCRGLSRKLTAWLQARIFDRSTHVFLMSEGMARFFRRHYGGVECSALVHSFNGPLPADSPPPPPQRPLQLITCGNINDSCLDATRRICQAVAQTPDVRYTFLSGRPRAYYESMGLLTDRIGYDTVPGDQVVQRMSQADIAILPHGFVGNYPPTEYETMFPTKTIEFLLSGRPILAHSPPDCYLTHFLKEHECALVADSPDVSAVAAAIERLRGDAVLRQKLVRRALHAARQFSAPIVAARFRQVVCGESAPTAGA